MWFVDCSLLGHTNLISRFWSYKSNDQAFFFETKVERKFVQTAKCIIECEVWAQDYKMQILVRFDVSAGCVNTIMVT